MHGDRLQDEISEPVQFLEVVGTGVPGYARAGTREFMRNLMQSQILGHPGASRSLRARTGNRVAQRTIL